MKPIIIHEKPIIVYEPKHTYYYEITAPECSRVYRGRTLCPHLRWSQHNSNYKAWLNGSKAYCTSYEVLKYPNAKLNVITEKDHTIPEANEYERYFIRSNPLCVNKRK